MQIGDVVEAKSLVGEDGFDGPGLFAHANPGEVGEVVDVFDAGWAMVRWRRTGTACQTHEDEISPRASE